MGKGSAVIRTDSARLTESRIELTSEDDLQSASLDFIAQSMLELTDATIASLSFLEAPNDGAKGGTLTITADDLRVTSTSPGTDSFVEVFNGGTGGSADVYVDVDGSIFLEGGSIRALAAPLEERERLNTQRQIGSLGDVEIKAGSIFIRDGGGITSTWINTVPTQDSASVLVVAEQMLEIEGTGLPTEDVGEASRISLNSVNAPTGVLRLVAPTMVLSNGGRITGSQVDEEVGTGVELRLAVGNLAVRSGSSIDASLGLEPQITEAATVIGLEAEELFPLATGLASASGSASIGGQPGDRDSSYRGPRFVGVRELLRRSVRRQYRDGGPRGDRVGERLDRSLRRTR